MNAIVGRQQETAEREKPRETRRGGSSTPAPAFGYEGRARLKKPRRGILRIRGKLGNRLKALTGDFPGRPVVKPAPSVGAPVQSLVKELTSHTAPPTMYVKNKKYFKKERSH